MAKPIVKSVGIVSFAVLVACGAVCQTSGQSLPDTPSVQGSTETQKFNAFVEENRSLKLGMMGGNTGMMRQGALVAFSDRMVSGQKESKTIFDKYLSSPSAKRLSGYRSTSGGSLMGRATYAASRIFVTRDESGKGRLNTSYLLRALTSVAADTASRPYWRRSPTGSVSDFGSTVGNDAGMNVWHEFRPGIEQLMKSHAPKFVSRIEARIGQK
ncbi:MAG: hypothetical protein ABR880_01505 [Candidatus Sulfotelmatobacter sp.]|jgi:hypothetical protein